MHLKEKKSSSNPRGGRPQEIPFKRIRIPLVNSLLSIFCLSLFLISPAIATFNGFYLGAAMGGAYASGSHSFTNNRGQSGVDKSTQGMVVVGGHFGYFAEIGKSQTILGWEVFYDRFMGSKSRDLVTTDGSILGKVQAQHQSGYGAAVHSGWAINRRLKFYVRAGVEKHTYLFKYSNLLFGDVSSERFKKSSIRFAPGMGFKFKVNDHLGFGLEHVVLLRSRIKPRSIARPINGVAREYTYRVTENRTMLKVSIIF